MEWEFKEPKMGDMIRTKIKFYHHYGIFIDEQTVLAFGMPDNSGVDPETIEVLTTDIVTFMHGSTLETAVLDRKERHDRRSPKETVDYALSQLGRKGYHILYNNCEHFANECMFGKSKSSFVDSVRDEIRKKMGKG
ncbi:MAG: lecithin retinol acyltransferase family protein [Clostridia bacterium]|nr:lecithin retinol acyltransferase family protein [Clostridia bacterium]